MIVHYHVEIVILFRVMRLIDHNLLLEAVMVKLEALRDGGQL